MKLNRTAKMAILMSASAALLGLGRAASAAVSPLVITEVDAGGSSQSYAADWFEITNTGSSAVDVNGYGVVDSHSETPPSTLSDVTIPAGGSAVFIDASGGATTASFESAWFGTNIPSNFVIGTYGPATTIGLSTSGDQVNLFMPDLTTKVYGVTWTSDAAGTTLDNSAGGLYTGTNATLSTLSSVGVNGAFTSFNGAEIGSPGVTGAVPEPASLGLLALGGVGLLARRRAKRA